MNVDVTERWLARFPLIGKLQPYSPPCPNNRRKKPLFFCGEGTGASWGAAGGRGCCADSRGGSAPLRCSNS